MSDEPDIEAEFAEVEDIEEEDQKKRSLISISMFEGDFCTVKGFVGVMKQEYAAFNVHISNPDPITVNVRRQALIQAIGILREELEKFDQ